MPRLKTMKKNYKQSPWQAGLLSRVTLLLCLAQFHAGAYVITTNALPNWRLSPTGCFCFLYCSTILPFSSPGLPFGSSWHWHLWSLCCAAGQSRLIKCQLLVTPALLGSDAFCSFLFSTMSQSHTACPQHHILQKNPKGMWWSSGWWHRGQGPQVWCQHLPVGEREEKWCTPGGVLSFSSWIQMPHNDGCGVKITAHHAHRVLRSSTPLQSGHVFSTKPFPRVSHLHMQEWWSSYFLGHILLFQCLRTLSMNFFSKYQT